MAVPGLGVLWRRAQQYLESQTSTQQAGRYLSIFALVFVVNRDFHLWTTANFLKQTKIYSEIPICVGYAQNTWTLFS